MPELRISCPHCKQDIMCDDQWAGQELQCPLCQGAFIMPGPGPAAASSKHNPLVPKPPSGGSKLSVGQAQVPAQAGRQIPIRNLTAPAAKKKSPVLKILVGTVVLAALGVGGYFGFGYIKTIQDKNKAKSQAEARNSDGGQVGHIANLNNVLDATEPGGAGLASVGSSPDRSRRARPTAPSPTAATAGTDPAAAAPNAPPEQIVPPKYTLDVDLASIPESKVNGTISGTNFVAETARVDTLGTTHVLRLLQGQPLSPDREVLIYLPSKPGEKLGGQSLTVSNMMRGAGVPQVWKRWKTSPQYLPTTKTFSLGYAMKLELGQTNADNTLPGKIYLALPDREQTVIAGSFKATVYQPDPNAQPVQYVQPAAVPQQQPSSASDAMQRRYGLKR